MVTEDCGIMVEEDGIRKIVAECMRGKIAITNDMIYAVTRQRVKEPTVSTIQARDITESYMTDEVQTKTGKRMSYLLKHGAISESYNNTSGIHDNCRYGFMVQ